MSEIRYIQTVMNEKGKIIERKIGKFKQTKQRGNKKTTVYIETTVTEKGNLIKMSYSKWSTR